MLGRARVGVLRFRFACVSWFSPKLQGARIYYLSIASVCNEFLRIYEIYKSRDEQNFFADRAEH